MYALLERKEVTREGVDYRTVGNELERVGRERKRI